MRAYRAVFTARMAALLQYRAAAVAGLATQFFWGLIRMMIFDAFYRSSSLPQPMTREQVTTYVWLGQAVFAFLPTWLDSEVQAAIRGGNVSYDLLRPLDLYRYWYFRNLAARLAPALLRCAPIFVFGWLFFGMALPASPAAAVMWAVSMLAALLLSASICTLTSVSMLWTVSGEGVRLFLGAAVWILCGIVLPLPLFPDWLQPLLNALPFRGLMDVPFRIWCGHISPAEAVPNILSVFAWTAALVVAGNALMARGMRKLVVQGG